MAASDRYSACGSTLDDFIAALTDARKHGAPSHAITEKYEPVSGFVISVADNPITLHTNEP
jgi:hypothetical protein